MEELVKNEYFVSVAMAVIIFACTQLLKMPIKLLTSKIANERVRRIVNGTILLIPFILGVVLDYVYCTAVTHQAVNVINGLGYGTAGISLYGVVERFFKVKVENPYETEEGQAVVELVENVKEDGKIDEKDKDAVSEFMDMISK
jgi:predicted neutral ceramidase superfamily lipid hydrolase